MIYLDNAATTQVSDEVFEAMLPYLKGEYGNPGTEYALGRQAASAIQHAREQVADLIHASPDDIIFTSGGSEANNLVFKGLENYLRAKEKTHLVVSIIEHDSVLKAALAMCDDDTTYEVDKHMLPVHGDGSVMFGELEELIDWDDSIGLVSVMYVNNEIGAVNNVKQIARICRENGILFHTDCVQALGSVPIDVNEIGCDFLTISSHKIHGAKGCGALYCRDRSLLTPLINGGNNQEFGLRGGTENVPAIVAFGQACECLNKSLDDDIKKIGEIKEEFYSTLLHSLEEKGGEDMVNIFHLNGIDDIVKSPKILNIRFDGVDGETLRLLLDAKGVCVSAGSACTSHEQKPSRVLRAIGLSDEDARNSIRVSFSRMNTVEEVREAAKIMADAVIRLKGVSLDFFGER